MKIVVIGASGTIGKVVTKDLQKRHEVITAGRSSGDIQLDITSRDSITEMYQALPELDAIVCAGGHGHFGPFRDTKEADFLHGLQSKLMGQINLVSVGLDYIKPKGSFTLITGILADHPVFGSVNLSTINGGIHGFVKAVALELGGYPRVNVVCPGLVADSEEALGKYFPGFNVIPMDRVAAAYADCVEGDMTGEVVRIFA